MTGKRERFAAFSDESRHLDGRYRSIASVSLDFDLVLRARDRIRSICDGAGVQELKWVDIDSSKHRKCANSAIDYFCSDLLSRGARIDVIVWDTHDSRHRVVGRDDRANYGRMFFHLHRASLRKRSPRAEWHLRPDHQVEIDWETVHSCLQHVGQQPRYHHPLLYDEGTPHNFEVRSFKSVDSREQPLCQLADLFAGMTPYSYEKRPMLREWYRTGGGRQSTLAGIDSTLSLSRSDRERMQVLDHLYGRCRDAKLGVSLRTEGCLRTPSGKGPVNFWLYTPQHPGDRAPTRAQDA